MKETGAEIIKHRRNQKEKENHVLLDVMLEEDSHFTSEEMVSLTIAIFMSMKMFLSICKHFEQNFSGYIWQYNAFDGNIRSVKALFLSYSFNVLLRQAR